MWRKRPHEPDLTRAEASVAPPQREHAQALYDRVIGWYEDAERKAQLILTLDGIFLTFVASSAFRDPTDLRAVTAQFGPETWTFLSLMAASLALSVISAVVALRSRLYTKKALREKLGSRDDAYGPATTWYFQHVANLDAGVLADHLAKADAKFAVQVLAVNVVPLSRNVVTKHRWVNRGFFFAGGVLWWFLAATTSYVLRV